MLILTKIEYRILLCSIIFSFFVGLLSACGDVGGSSRSFSTSMIPPGPMMSVLAGNVAGWGYLDGIGTQARFNTPSGIATDITGNVYVADSNNNIIRKITPGGVVSTFAGQAGVAGSADGQATQARFDYPSGISADNVGNVYVADSNNNTIRKITPAGVVSTFAGRAGVKGSADGEGAQARFFRPYGIATDRSGNVYVADSNNNTIRKITSAGVVSTFAGRAGVKGSADGEGSQARFFRPYGIATDRSGNVYVADRNNNTIRKITPAGVVSTFAGLAGVHGSTDSTGTKARFFRPYGIATDRSGNVYVADVYNQIIRKITQAGVVSTFAGKAGETGSTDSQDIQAKFNYPTGIATDKAGNVYVADRYNDTIRKITPTGIVNTFAGKAGASGFSNGQGVHELFNLPSGIAIDRAGNVYVADTFNFTIRKITPAGVVSTFAGEAGVTGSTDGDGAQASFHYPHGVATDRAGNVYVADTDNNTIRKITPAGVVSTFAGQAGVHGSTDSTGTKARFFRPYGVATDSAGNVYVADTDNQTIRKITPAGVVSTLAGEAGVIGSTDGHGLQAKFNYPHSVATDRAGNVYVADTDNNTVRKITPDGIVSTFAVQAGVTGSADSKGEQAIFSKPYGIAIDSEDNVYVSDMSSQTPRKITPDGDLITFIGAVSKQSFRSGALTEVNAFPTAIAISGKKMYYTIKNGVVQVSNLP